MASGFSGRAVAAVMLFIVAAMLAGCRQPQTPNEKQARLLAAENLQLRKQLADQRTKAETLQKQEAQELATCRARADQLQKDLEQGIAERVRDVTTQVMDENARLRKEIETLRAQTEKLKAQPTQP